VVQLVGGAASSWKRFLQRRGGEGRKYLHLLTKNGGKGRMLMLSRHSVVFRTKGLKKKDHRPLVYASQEVGTNARLGSPLPFPACGEKRRERERLFPRERRKGSTIMQSLLKNKRGEAIYLLHKGKRNHRAPVEAGPFKYACLEKRGGERPMPSLFDRERKRGRVLGLHLDCVGEKRGGKSGKSPIIQRKESQSKWEASSTSC